MQNAVPGFELRMSLVHRSEGKLELGDPGLLFIEHCLCLAELDVGLSQFLQHGECALLDWALFICSRSFDRPSVFSTTHVAVHHRISVDLKRICNNY